MKVILQDYEPRPMPVAATIRQTAVAPVRQARVRLNPIAGDMRLFHAL